MALLFPHLPRGDLDDPRSPYTKHGGRGGAAGVVNIPVSHPSTILVIVVSHQLVPLLFPTGGEEQEDESVGQVDASRDVEHLTPLLKRLLQNENKKEENE